MAKSKQKLYYYRNESTSELTLPYYGRIAPRGVLTANEPVENPNLKAIEENEALAIVKGVDSTEGLKGSES